MNFADAAWERYKHRQALAATKRTPTYEEDVAARCGEVADEQDRLLADTQRMIRRRAMIANQDDPRRGPGQIVRTEWSDAHGLTCDGDPEILTILDGKVVR